MIAKMMSAAGFNDLNALSSMLNPKGEDSSDDDMIESGTVSTFTPGSIGKKKTSKKDPKPSPYEKLEGGDGQCKGDIWSSHEVAATGFNEEDEGKIRPEYEIMYKQAIGSEDMFLGMSGKTPSSAHCEDMIVDVKLPDALVKEVDLEIEVNHIDVRHKKYRLHLPLPHPVDPKQGKAEWDKKKENLRVTLRMTREYDFVNF